MGALTKIEWADHSFNPWIGCTRVSAGCEHCYAEALSKRTGLAQWGPKATRHLTSDQNWKQPLKWNADARAKGIRARVFCASLADVFDDHPSIAQEWRTRLWTLIANTQALDWLLLTKRPYNWFKPFALPSGEVQIGYRHVRLGVTIEDENAVEARAAALLTASALGWKTFVSYEPALGPVDWRPLLEARAIGWLIAGGESGAGARPAHPDWFRLARDQCAQFDVPFLFKQHGEWLHETQPTGTLLDYPGRKALHAFPDETCSVRIGKKASGRLLDNREHNAFPEAA